MGHRELGQVYSGALRHTMIVAVQEGMGMRTRTTLMGGGGLVGGYDWRTSTPWAALKAEMLCGG